MSLEHGVSADLLMPASDALFKIRATPVNVSRKRKRNDATNAENKPQLFEAKALRSGDTPSICLLPLVTLDRQHVPIAWLDTSSKQAHLPPEFVFSAQLPGDGLIDRKVLIAETQNGLLCAVEIVGPNTFIACPLHEWVSTEMIKLALKGEQSPIQLGLLIGEQEPQRDPRGNGSFDSFKSISPKKPINRKGALARLSLLPESRSEMKKGSVANSPTAQNQPSSQIYEMNEKVIKSAEFSPSGIHLDQAHVQAGIGIGFEKTHSMATQLPTGTPISSFTPDSVQQHYLEALYLSKTSLAFYAKGPLGRSRAEALDARNTESLAEAYRDAILSVKKMDKKYKETLPKVIYERRTTENLDSVDVPAPQTMKRRKGKRVGKDCLWPEEGLLIEKWWEITEIGSAARGVDSFAEEKRRAILDLRTRETIMQMLLILETMILETKPTRKDPVDPNIKVESIEDTKPHLKNIPETQSSDRKKKDLQPELDNIIDRLCIWHSIDIEQSGPSPEKSTGNLSERKSEDKLRDFCTDIIIPFYSSKLPLQAKAICRKLGGFEVASHRRKSVRETSVNRLQPGAAVNPRQPALRKTLQLVLNEDSSRHSSSPVLPRSSPAPIAPRLKREPSERPSSRTGLHKSISFSNREIDLTADARASNTKRKKHNQINQQKKELEAAINALKKPNRGLAGQSFMDEVEKRDILRRQIQITATPKRARTSMILPEPELPNPVNDLVPSSTVKSGFAARISQSISRRSTKKQAVLSAINETPSRGVDRKISNPLDINLPSNTGVIQSTPVKSVDRSSNDLTPTILTPSVSIPQDQMHLQTPILRPQLSRNRQLKQGTIFSTPFTSHRTITTPEQTRNELDIPESAGRTMDRVMSAKAVGGGSDYFALTFSRSPVTRNELSQPPVPSTPVVVKTIANPPNIQQLAQTRSIYEQLSWDDDYKIND